MACNSCITYVIAFYVLLLAFVAAVLSVYKLSSRRGVVDGSEPTADGNTTLVNWLTDLLSSTLDQYGFPFGQICITFLYSTYKRFTWLNAMILFLKYVPTGLYMYKTLRSIYKTSRERIKKTQMELDDIQLQIQIVNTKLRVRDAEFTERTEQLRRHAERLRALRARVRGMIAADDALRRALQHAAEPAPPADAPDNEHDFFTTFTPEEEREFIINLLKELKDGEQFVTPEQTEKLERGEQSVGDEDPESVYSSLSDVDAKDCRVKIVKVTNVYRVACLKHYIKQKRLRRATQQAILKKKIESIKKLLESWQKSLNTVIYNKLSRDPNVELASQEAMGDYSKPNLREFSDSDTELKTSCTDVCYDELNISWAQTPYSYDGNTESPEKDIFESEDFASQAHEIAYSHAHTHAHAHTHTHAPMCECEAAAGSVLFILPEETSSQVAIEEIDTECRDMVAI